MSENQIIELINRLDTSSFTEQDVYWNQIKNLEIDIPFYFLKVYPTFKKWQGRVTLVFNCVKYARTNDYAFELGKLALYDKATLVRYRASSLLAYSLRKEAIPYLEKNLNHIDKETQNDAIRAIKAINKCNHHLFMSNHRNSFWIVNEELDKKEDIENKYIKLIKNLFK